MLILNPVVEKVYTNDWLIQNNYAFSYDGGKKQIGEYLSKQMKQPIQKNDKFDIF